MTALATLSPTAVSVAPGERALIELKVRNASNVVDRFTFEVLGPLTPWAHVEPAEVSIFPGQEAVVFVCFDVPRDPQAAASEVAFAVKVISQEHADGSIVEEGVLRIGTYVEFGAELVPRMSRGRRTARHRVRVDNRGNTRMDVTFRGTDAEGALRFSFAPATLLVEAGTSACATVRLRPNRLPIRGAREHRAFQVVVEPGGAPVVLDGTMIQQPLVSDRLARALAISAAVILGLVVLWLGVFRPTVESAAKRAVAPSLAVQTQQANQQREAINDLRLASGKPPLPVAGAELDAGSSDGGTGTGSGTGTPALTRPFDHRLEANGAPEATDEKSVGEKEAITVTDLLLQNPMGNVGMVEFRRGDMVLLRQALENFRDFDFHFVSPVLFKAGESIVLRVECANPDGAPCAVAAYLSGVLQTQP